MRRVAFLLHWLGIIFIVHAFMLVGADEINSLESGVRTIRPLHQILALYGTDPSALMNSPTQIGALFTMVMSAPGWAVFAILGIITMALGRRSPMEPLDDERAEASPSKSPVVAAVAAHEGLADPPPA